MPEIAGFTRVISYDRAGLGESEQAGRQADLARLSTRGQSVIGRGSGHFVHRYDPDLVVGIIKAMVEENRAGKH